MLVALVETFSPIQSNPIQSIQVNVPGGNVILALAGGKLRMCLLGQRSNRCIL
ncbi:hypothetical protein [Pseudomonas yangonensis]|uniref:hypothetical protein n=1 Tax=Pseudomonas yangonensis TaxID=2579922 RepID=UPI001379D401|nr:hypothetical protein [Pseudomonas yangonensis]